MKKVLIVGDSRKMRGGVNAVIRTMESSYLWKKYETYWVECQINASVFLKILYIVRGNIIGLMKIPFYHIINFQTTPVGLRRLTPIFLLGVLMKKKIIIHLHVGNQLKDYHNDRFFKWCCRKADKILTMGRMWMTEVPISDKSKIDYLYNPAPSLVTPTIGNKYFLFAAYLDAENNKGQDTLVKAFANVTKTHPEWKLVICGTGNVDALKQLVRCLGIEKNVEFPGWVDGNEKQRYFNQAYCYVMASLKEGLPISILEAMSYGKPLITTPVGCLPEFLVDKESALIFDFNDVGRLSVCMNEMIENKELYFNLVKREQEIIKENFTKEKFLEKLDRIYQSLN